MKTSNLKKFERIPLVKIPPDTPEETAAFIAELLLIAERMPGAITPTRTKINSSGENVTGTNSGVDTGTVGTGTISGDSENP